MKKFLFGAISLIMAVSVGVLSAVTVSFKKNANFRNEINSIVDTPETENKTSANEEELSRLYKEISKLENQIIEKEEELELVNAELETAQNENSANEELIASLNSQKEMLESDVLTLEQEIEDLENQIAGLNVQYEVEDMYSLKSQKTYQLDLGNVKDVSLIANTTYHEEETDYILRKYGTEFNEKLDIEFNGINFNTKYWLSKDGNKLFFILDDNTLVGYEDVDGSFNKILEHKIEVEIVNVSAFDDFVFIFTKTSPCVYAYKIVNQVLVQCNIDLSSFEDLSVLETYTLIDIVQGKNGTFMLGFVVPIDDLTDAYTLYLTFDSNTNSFIYESYLKTSTYLFTYMLAFHKNNFSDAQIIYLQAGATSSKCRRAIHSIDKTSTDGYNITAYYYTYATTNVYVKNRAVISEKVSDVTATMWFYYYPQVYRVQFEKYDEKDIKNHLSSNLLYLFQKMPDGTHRAFVLNDLTKEDGSLTELKLPETLEQTNIERIEALDSVVLFFMKDGSVEVYNIKTDFLIAENVSIKNAEYKVLCTKEISMLEYVEKQDEIADDYNLFLNNLSDEAYQLEKYIFENGQVFIQKKEDNSGYVFLKTSYSFKNLASGIIIETVSQDSGLDLKISSLVGTLDYVYIDATQTFTQKQTA